MDSLLNLVRDYLIRNQGSILTMTYKCIAKDNAGTPRAWGVGPTEAIALEQAGQAVAEKYPCRPGLYPFTYQTTEE